MLNYLPAWRFASPGAVASGVEEDFLFLIKKVAGQYGDRQQIIEHYKTYFADAAGRPSYTSSSLGWAESDLIDYMRSAAENAPLFIEAFFDAGASLTTRNPQLIVPDVTTINSVLTKHAAGYEVKLPDLISHKQQMPISVPDRIASLDEQALEIIQKSLKHSEELLALGHENSSTPTGAFAAGRLA